MNPCFLSPFSLPPAGITSANSLHRAPRRARRPNAARHAPRALVGGAPTDSPYDFLAPTPSDDTDDAPLEPEFREDVPLLNSVVLTGRLGQDPTLRQVGRNMTDLCTFSLAVADDVFESGAERTTSWFNIQFWGSSAGRAAAALRKGLRVGITGTLSVDEWTGRDGQTRNTVSLTGTSFEVLQSRSEIGFDAPPGRPAGGASRASTASFQSGGAAKVGGGAGADFEELDPF